MLLLIQSSLLLPASVFVAIAFVIVPLLMRNIKSDDRYDYLDVYIKQNLSYRSVKVRQDLKSEVYEISRIGLAITNNPKEEWRILSDDERKQIENQIKDNHEAIYLTLTDSLL